MLTLPLLSIFRLGGAEADRGYELPVFAFIGLNQENLQKRGRRLCRDNLRSPEASLERIFELEDKVLSLVKDRKLELIGHVHLLDNFGTEDQHLPLGAGVVGYARCEIAGRNGL